MNQPNIIAINGQLADRLALDIQAALCGKYTTTLNNETLGPTYPQGEVTIIVDGLKFPSLGYDEESGYWPDALKSGNAP